MRTLDTCLVKAIAATVFGNDTKICASVYANEGTANFSFQALNSNNYWYDEVQNNDNNKLYSLRGDQLCDFYFDCHFDNKSHPDYWNLCTIEVSRDGSYQIDFAYKPELDEENEKETIESIGQELYDQYQREDRERREQATQQPEAVTKSQASPQPEELTIPELLGFISSELQKDLPADWAKLIVNAEVFEEDAKQAVSMVSYYVAGNADPQRFTPSNNIGPMNALLRFHKQLAQQGQQWRKATLTFDVNGGVEMQSE